MSFLLDWKERLKGIYQFQISYILGLQIRSNILFKLSSHTLLKILRYSNHKLNLNTIKLLKLCFMRILPRDIIQILLIVNNLNILRDYNFLKNYLIWLTSPLTSILIINPTKAKQIVWSRIYREWYLIDSCVCCKS